MLAGAKYNAAQYLFAGDSVHIGLYVLEFFADVAEGDDGGHSHVGLLVERIVG